MSDSLEFDGGARLADRRIELGHHRLAADHALAGRDQQTRPLRQVEVCTTTKADMAETFPRRDRLPGFT